MFIQHLHPLLVPVAYVQSGTWDLPHQPLATPDMVLTWAEYGDGMSYLSQAGFTELQATAPGWQQQALDNVRQTRRFHSHVSGRNARKPDWIAFLNDKDTIGSSKVLLAFELSRIFPQGYLIAVPDRACGIVVSAACSVPARRKVQELITSMHADASTPMSAQLYPAEAFALPAEWTAPLAADSTTAAILDLFGKPLPKRHRQ